MSTLDEWRALRKQEAWIDASLFTPRERQRYRRRLRLKTFATLAIFVLAHFVLPWWAPTVGLIVFIGVVIWRFSSWDRRKYIQAFFDLRRDVGSASTLTGKVHFAVVFVRHKYRAKNKVRQAMGELESAFAYLQKQAQCYGKTVSFENVVHPDPVRAHISLHAVEFGPHLVNEQDAQLEEVDVAIAVGDPLEDLDLVVQPFQWAGSNLGSISLLVGSLSV